KPAYGSAGAEVLGPVDPALRVLGGAYSDVGVRAVHDVPAVAVAVHPALDHLGRRALPHGDVLGHGRAGEAGGADAVGHVAAVEGVVVEVAVPRHVGRVPVGGLAEPGVVLERAAAGLGPLVVGQPADLVLDGRADGGGGGRAGRGSTLRGGGRGGG